MPAKLIERVAAGMRAVRVLRSADAVAITDDDHEREGATVIATIADVTVVRWSETVAVTDQLDQTAQNGLVMRVEPSARARRGAATGDGATENLTARQ